MSRKTLSIAPRSVILLVGMTFGCGELVESAFAQEWRVVDTGQDACYSATGPIECPPGGSAFYGQDAQYRGNQPAYRDNRDGTVTDLVTGLMWAQALNEKVTWGEAVVGASRFTLAGYDDWRLPTIKELYSLIDFRGGFHFTPSASKPYIDTDYFAFEYGDESAGERPIDVQVWSGTRYVGTTMRNGETVFGVNFADGRIKGYPMYEPRSDGTIEHRMFIRYVRGNQGYGQNDFADNGDGTVTDRATGLLWQKADDGVTRDWQDALAYREELVLAGLGDWRLPNAKELHSIVDYRRAPAVTGTAAMDPVFEVTEAQSYYWTSTTHLDGPIKRMGRAAVYVAFGQAFGYVQMPPGSGNYRLGDAHGAGAQRSDPKRGDPAEYPHGRGPQGDDIRIYNYARCVRSGAMPTGL
jgi:hypothetical protein